MADLGTYAVLLALAASVWGVVASLVGAIRGRDDFVRSAEGAVYATLLAIGTAWLTLLAALVTSDFSLEYVVDYTSRSLSWPYKLAASWAGQGGSLLLWTLIAACCAVWITVQNRRKAWGIAPYAITTFSAITGMFAALVAFVASPFAAAPAGVADGQGLNPLLQDPLQIIHPVTLYLGYVLYTVPFALVIAALAGGPKPGPWVKVATRWGIASWVMLTLGIVLGARWAYAELGWGGYWAWDPVENASLMPWLTGTVLLHSGLTYWKNGRIRLFGVVMVIVTFVLCLFGTFLTRSGVISSVHAFGESGIGPVLGLMILSIVLVSGALIVWRLPELRLPKNVESRGHGWVGQLALAVLLVGITVAVLWGTMFPLIARALHGEEIAVTPGFFRLVVTPLALVLLAVFAVSPLLPDQSEEKRAREIAVRVAVFVVVFLAVWSLTGGGNPGVAAVIALVVLGLMTVVRKAARRMSAAWRGTPASGGRLLATLRAAGPYVGHVGLIILLAAVTFNDAMQTQGRATYTFGQTQEVAGRQMRLVDVTATTLPDRQSFAATVQILGPDGNVTDTIVSKQEVFAQQEQPHADVGIAAGALRDVYVVLESADLEKRNATITVFVNPAVVWIWIGGLLLTIGGLLFMLPRPKAAPALPLERVEHHDEPAPDDEKVEV